MIAPIYSICMQFPLADPLEFLLTASSMPEILISMAFLLCFPSLPLVRGISAPLVVKMPVSRLFTLLNEEGGGGGYCYFLGVKRLV